jgi:hypothetical protein
MPEPIARGVFETAQVQLKDDRSADCTLLRAWIGVVCSRP